MRPAGAGNVTAQEATKEEKECNKNFMHGEELKEVPQSMKEEMKKKTCKGKRVHTSASVFFLCV